MVSKQMGWDVLTFVCGYPGENKGRGSVNVAKNKEQGFPLKEMCMARFNSQEAFEKEVAKARKKSQWFGVSLASNVLSYEEI